MGRLLVLAAVILGLLAVGYEGTGVCRHPQGREGESFTEGCLKRRCKGGVWRTSLDSSLCCYEGKPYPVNTILSTTMSEDHCVKASIECKEDNGKARMIAGMKNFCADYATQEQVEEIKDLLVKGFDPNCEAAEPGDTENSEPTRDLILLDSTQTPQVLQLPSFDPLPGCTVPSYPIDVVYTVSMLLGGHVTLCGGQDNRRKGSSPCYQLQGKDWVDVQGLSSVRLSAAASAHSEGVLVTGGYNVSQDLKLQTSEYLLHSGAGLPGPDLPSPLAKHCQVTVGSDLFIIGGVDDNGGLATAYKLDGDKWLPLQNMTTPRFSHTCTVLDNSIYVIGGASAESGVERLDLASMTWKTEGPFFKGPLPFNLDFYGGQAVVYDSTIYLIRSNGEVYELDIDRELKQSKLHFVKKLSKMWWRTTFPIPIVSAEQVGC